MRESMNNMEVRAINKDRIVEVLLREEKLTKAGITEALGLSLVTVSNLLKELLEEGLVEQGEALQSTGGRRPTLYQVVPDTYTSLGIALTPHHIRLAYVNWKLDVSAADEKKILFEDNDLFWGEFLNFVQNFMKEHGIDEEKLVGIGLSFPSEIVGQNSLEDIRPIGVFKNMDLERIRGFFKCPVMFSEDMKAAGFSHIGPLKHRNRYVYVQLGRRVGGALINDGDFYGLSNRTGSFGEMIVGDVDVKDGYLETIVGRGRQNSMQYFCGADALTGTGEVPVKNFFEELDAGDEDCLEKWNSYIGHLAIALLNLRVIFDSDIMIGGEVSPFIAERRDILLDLLKHGDIYNEDPEKYIHFSKGEEYDSAIGTGYLILEKHAEIPRK